MMRISNCWDNGAKDKVNRLEGPPARSQGPKGPLTSSLSYLNFTCHIKHLTNLYFTELNRTEGQAGRLKLQQACHKTSEVSPTLVISTSSTLTAVLRFCFNMSEVLLKLSLISSFQNRPVQIGVKTIGAGLDKYCMNTLISDGQRRRSNRKLICDVQSNSLQSMMRRPLNTENLRKYYSGGRGRSFLEQVKIISKFRNAISPYTMSPCRTSPYTMVQCNEQFQQQKRPRRQFQYGRRGRRFFPPSQR